MHRVPGLRNLTSTYKNSPDHREYIAAKHAQAELREAILNSSATGIPVLRREMLWTTLVEDYQVEEGIQDWVEHLLRAFKEGSGQHKWSDTSATGKIVSKLT